MRTTDLDAAPPRLIVGHFDIVPLPKTPSTVSPISCCSARISPLFVNFP